MRFMELIRDFVRLGVESAYIDASYKSAKPQMEKEDYQIISIPQNVDLRLLAGRDSSVSRKGNWVREGILFVPGKQTRFVRNSPLFGRSLDGLEESKEYYLSDKEVESALENSIEYPSESRKVPTNRFGEDDFAVYAIGDGDSNRASQYGFLLLDAEVEEISFLSMNREFMRECEQSDSRPFIRQIYFEGLSEFLAEEPINFSLDGFMFGTERFRGIRLLRGKL